MVLENYANYIINDLGYNHFIKNGIITGSVCGIMGGLIGVYENKSTNDTIEYVFAFSKTGFISGILTPVLLPGLIVVLPVVAIKQVIKLLKWFHVHRLKPFRFSANSRFVFYIK